jgi:hypothetical protein
MFNINRFLPTPQKIILEHNFKNYLYDSVNRFNKQTIKINEDIRRKNEIQQILYGNENKIALIKSTNHSVDDLINNTKFYKFFFIISVMSIGALISYKRNQ